MRDLLGLSLEQLSRLLEAESARAELRREYEQTEDPGTRRRLLEEALGISRPSSSSSAAAATRSRSSSGSSRGAAGLVRARSPSSAESRAQRLDGYPGQR